MLISVFLAACQVAKADFLGPQSPSTQISPRFRELYELLGSTAVSGPAISADWEDGGREYQYTEATLMVYDPYLPDGRRWGLAPIGRELGLSNMPASGQEAWLSEGYPVDPIFLATYEKMGGSRICGQALSTLKYNPILNRYEQYFENVGLYRLEGADASQVKLLAYGSWKCGEACQGEPSPEGRLWMVGPVQPPFSEAVQRLDAALTGFAISQPFVASDGLVEQIFENVSIVINPAAPLGFSLRALPEKLGQIPGAYEAEIQRSDLRFLRLLGASGYNVPVFFIDYINAHGTFEASGPPIAPFEQLPGGGVRQCFTAYCLEIQPGTQAVLPQPLGYSYKVLHTAQAAVTPAPSAEKDQVISLQVSERYPSLSGQQNQEIVVVVTRDGAALKDAQTILTVSLPGGDQQYPMPLTDSAGQAFLVLPLVEAPNSTLIPYQVCLERQPGGKFCVRDDFLIWNNP